MGSALLIMRDEAELIRDTLNEDREAFGILVRTYETATYALALQRVGSAAAAQDIAQEVFVTAYRKLDQLRDRGRFGGWLRSITLRQCGMWERSEKRRPDTVPLPVEEAAAGSSPANAARRSDEAAFGIETMIRELPRSLRAAAVLCLEDELSPSAAAAVLGLKPGTLRKRLHDARARLQRIIVEKAEKELRTHLLPRDFAKRCVCRCEKAQEAKLRKEVMTVAEKKNCGCGCAGASKRRAKAATKTKPKGKK